MSDRELLELAAKAAGNGAAWYGSLGMAIDDGQALPRLWCPQTNLGDATRLLLALKLRVDYVGDQPAIDGVLVSGMSAEESFCRAVVRAAAAMAKE